MRRSSHNTLHQTIRTLLQEGLPGEPAQRVMAPELGNGRITALKKNPKAKLSAVCIALYPSQGEWFFPLIQRPTYNGTHSGQISLPGGKKEESDRSMKDTALRETQEEVGIPLSAMKVAGELTQVYVPPSGFLVNTFIATLETRPQFIAEEKEVEEIVEIPVSALLNPETLKSTEMSFQNSNMKLNTPYFDLQGKVVWGATAMILAEFKALMNRIDW